MEKNPQRFTEKAERAFYIVCSNIFSFLDFPSLMRSLVVSTEFYNLLNKYFKSFLTSNNLIDPNDIPVSGDHYLKLFRAFYSREVLVADLSSITKSYDELRFTRYPRCSTYGVKDFNMGIKFTVFQLFNNDIIFLKTEEYIDPSFNAKSIQRKNRRKDVKKFDARGKELFYMTFTGQLYVIFHSDDRRSDELSEGLLEFTIYQPLKDFDVAYNQAILFMRIPESQNEKYIEDHKEEKEYQPIKKKMFQDIRYLSLQSLMPDDLNASLRLKKIDGLDDQEILSFCVGNTAAYFINTENRVFECDFSVVNNDKYMIFPFEPLKNKSIKKLWCGYTFFFALEQAEIESIDKWAQKEILQWVRTKDFSEYHNVIKYENITGKELLSANNQFLQDRIGMTRKDLQTKFIGEIEKVAKKTFKKPKIYGWGNNQYGRLGLNTGNVTVSAPVEVALPDLDPEDEITHIECGWKASSILTKKGQVWLSGSVVKKNTKDEEESAQSNQSKKKKSSMEKESDKVEHKWFNMTPLCQKFRDGRHYQIIKVSFAKEKFAALGANLGHKKKVKSQETENKTSFSQFKGADHILNRIMWDKRLNPDEFVVGYEDRFLGILEMPFNEFSLKTEIPSHRIKFFKKNGEVVWDRGLKMINF